MEDRDRDRVAAGGVAAVPGGVLFGEQTVASLGEGIRRFESTRFEPLALRKLAEPFATERFDRQIQAAFDRGYAEWRAGAPAPSKQR
jgi:hypothetical protein